MRTKFLSIFVILFSLCQVGFGFAQQIDSLISEALQNNLQLKSLEYQITSVEYRAKSIGLPPPVLGFEFSQIPVGEYNIWNNALSNSISLSQMFHLGGKLKAMRDAENKKSLVASNDLVLYRVNLIAQLKMAYYNFWLIERKTEVQQKSIELLNNLWSSSSIGYQINRIHQADLLALKSEIAVGQAQLLILENQKEAVVYQLNKLLGRDLNSKKVYAMKDISSDSLTISQDQLEEKLEKMNPELQKMSSMIEMNLAMQKSVRKEAIPDMMLQAMIMRMPRGMILTSASDLSMLEKKSETMYGLMASFTLPFMPWSAKKYKMQAQELSAEIKSIESNRMDMQREMNVRLKEALVKFKSANDLTTLYADQVLPLYRQAAAARISDYQNNQANMSTVIDAYKMLVMQEMNFYMAQADHQMAKAEIEMMIGEELPE